MTDRDLEPRTSFQDELATEGMTDPREAHAPHAVHPSAKEYVRIGVVLGALTGTEVYISYSSLPHGLLIALLFVAAVIKFALVVLWFMHLRFDDRRYARFFVMGISGAFTLYAIVLISFKVFSR
jgi:cytochrome c oxidase subunit IV